MTTEKDAMAVAVLDDAEAWANQPHRPSVARVREARAHLVARLLHLTQLAEHHRLNAEAASESVKFYTRKLDDAEAELAAVKAALPAEIHERGEFERGYNAAVRNFATAVDAARGRDK